MKIEVLSATYSNEEKTAYTAIVRDTDGEFFDGETFPYGVIVGQEEGTPLYSAIMEKMSGVEIQAYVAPQVSDETLARSARAKRDALLAACDYYMMPDYPAKDLEGMKAYRQALRDVPTQEGFPRLIDWPVSPEDA